MQADPQELGSWRLSRRTFVQGSFGALALLTLPCPSRAWASPGLKQGYVNPHPALFYQALENNWVKCLLCPNGCAVPEGNRGNCGVRENRGGKYYTLVYANPCAVHVDPVEKKPFFHVLPGSFSYSIATAGCNLHCKFCQNWEISQALPEETYNIDLPPIQVVAQAQQMRAASIAHTYVEPTIFYEYMLAVGQLAKKAGVLNVYHSNGYINPEPLEKLADVLDAACIDLKAFTNKFYQELSDGKLEPVLNTLQTLHRRGVPVEVVNLVIPQHNDRPEEITAMCRWIKENLGPLTPLHFSRFYPMHKMLNLNPTPVSTLEKARDLARQEGLKYVYIGNLPGHEAENTYCHSCGKMIISRRGYLIGEVTMKDGHCGYCGAEIPGIWKQPQVS
ncbi:MAG: AmmeMemoRadiSam system radical SAM enzyme [Syntrophobacterales bacterium]|jgi:pyruvate formate lyase activating enzyme